MTYVTEALGIVLIFATIWAMPYLQRWLYRHAYRWMTGHDPDHNPYDDLIKH